VPPSEGVAVTAANGPEDAASYNRRTVEASHFDERSFFSAVHASGVRALRHGRYVLENDEHVDVLLARSVPTLHGLPVDLEGHRLKLVATISEPGPNRPTYSRPDGSPFTW